MQEMFNKPLCLMDGNGWGSLEKQFESNKRVLSVKLRNLILIL